MNKKMESNRKSTVRNFCERKFVDWYELRNLTEFDRDYLIASLELLDTSSSGGFDCVEIKRIQQEVPKSVSNTFDRHFWYSQHSLSDLYLLKIPITEKSAFILLICGLLNDGWDNSGSWIEVLDGQGELLGSGKFRDEGIFWQDRQLNGEDFTTPAPSWIGDDAERPIPRKKWEDEMNPMWSEEILTKHAVSIEHKDGKTRYLMSV
jgi:hypothetical protein